MAESEKTRKHTQTVIWTWETVYNACCCIARDIKDHEEDETFKFREIIAVSRGGLVPATILSHLLSLPITGVIINNRPERSLLVGSLRSLIIVDDICDTGATFQQMNRFFPGAFRVCMCSKVSGRGNYESCSLEYDDSDWLQFPWELDAL